MKNKKLENVKLENEKMEIMDERTKRERALECKVKVYRAWTCILAATLIVTHILLVLGF